MKKLLLTFLLFSSVSANAGQNFLGLTEDQCTRNQFDGNESICSSMVSGSEYINDRIKLFKAMNEYFIRRYYDYDSIEIVGVKKVRDGIWWKDKKIDRRTDMLVDFRYTQIGDRDYERCTIRFKQFENQGDSNPFSPIVNSLKCTLVKYDYSHGGI